MSTEESKHPSRPPAGDAGSACPSFVAAMDVVGRRWSGRVVQALGAGCQGFAEIARHVGGVSDQVLARRLRELESDGLVSRSVTDGHPPLVRYRLTEVGGALLPVLDALTDWGHQLLESMGDGGEPQEEPLGGREVLPAWARGGLTTGGTPGAARPPEPGPVAPVGARSTNDQSLRTEQDS